MWLDNDMNNALTARKNALMASINTATLVGTLLAIDSISPRTPDQSTARRLLIEEIEARHDVEDAMNAWSEDVTGEVSYVQALIAALPLAALAA